MGNTEELWEPDLTTLLFYQDGILPKGFQSLQTYNDRLQDIRWEQN
jgi:hypothetical protein